MISQFCVILEGTWAVTITVFLKSQGGSGSVHVHLPRPYPREPEFRQAMLQALVSSLCTSCLWGGSPCTSSFHLGKVIQSTSKTMSWFLREPHAPGDMLVLQVPYTRTTYDTRKVKNKPPASSSALTFAFQNTRYSQQAFLLCT